MSPSPSANGQRPAEEADDFNAFYRTEYPRMLAVAIALSGSMESGEDLAQEAFLSLHRQWPRISGYDNPSAWVRRVVANRSISRFRRLDNEARALRRVAARRNSDDADLTEDHDDVWDLVRELPRRQAQVVALTYLDDQPLADVAEILGISVATAKTHLQRGCRALARRLGEDHDAEPSS